MAVGGVISLKYFVMGERRKLISDPGQSGSSHLVRPFRLAATRFLLAATRC